MTVNTIEKTTRYYYDDRRVAVQTLVSGGVETDDRYFVFGNYIDEVLLMHRDTADRYYLHDHLYSPVALLDDTGAVVERYEYDAYGKVQILTSNFSPLTSSQHGNPYAFTGRELDTLDAGSRKLYHFRHRDYSPDLARFLQNDPLIYVDGLNLYQYTNGNPLQFTDPTGQSACKDCDVIRKAQRPLPNRRSNSTGRVDVRWAIVTSISRDPSCGYRLIIKNGGCRINAWFYSPPEPEMIYPNGETPEDHENTHVRLSASAWSSVKNFADSLNGVCSCSYGLINCLQELIITYLDLKWWANRADNYGYDCRVYFGTTETNPSKKHACLQEVESYNKYQETYRKFDLILNSFRPGSPSHPCGTASPRIGDRSHGKTTDSH